MVLTSAQIQELNESKPQVLKSSPIQKPSEPSLDLAPHHRALVPIVEESQYPQLMSSSMVANSPEPNTFIYGSSKPAGSK